MQHMHVIILATISGPSPLQSRQHPPQHPFAFQSTNKPQPRPRHQPSSPRPGYQATPLSPRSNSNTLPELAGAPGGPSPQAPPCAHAPPRRHGHAQLRMCVEPCPVTGRPTCSWPTRPTPRAARAPPSSAAGPTGRQPGPGGCSAGAFARWCRCPAWAAG